MNNPTAQIRDLVQSLKPEVKNSQLYLTFENKGRVENFLIRLDRKVKDEGKTKLATLYKEKYGVAISMRTCEGVLKEVIASLKRKPSQNDIPLAMLTETPFHRDVLVQTPIRSIKLHYASNTVRQMDKESGNYYPIAEWVIPEVHHRYETIDVNGITKVEYDLSIDGHRETINKSDISNGRYHSHFSNLSNVESRYLKEAHATIITSLARKALLIQTFNTTGFYPYAEEGKEKYGYMLPTGRFITVDGERQNTHLATNLDHEQVKLWSTFEEKTQVTKRQLQALYSYLKGVTPNGLLLFLTCHNTRAIGHFLRSSTFKCGYGVFLLGIGGTGKTELASLARGVAQPYIYKGNLDATFRDTTATVETQISHLKDIPIILDDLNKARGEGSYVSSDEKCIDRIARASHDGLQVRGRRNANMSRQNSNFIRTLFTVTGEYFPTSMQRSTFRRLLTVETHPRDIHRIISPAYTHSLEQYEAHSYSQFALGRKVIMHFLEQLNRLGHEKTVQRYEAIYQKFRASIRIAICTMWNEKQHIALPHDTDNLIDIASHILLGGYFLDEVSEGVTQFVKDTQDFIVSTLYIHICRMEGLTPDEEDNLPFASVLVEFQEYIRDGRAFRVDGGSVVLKISDYYNSNTQPTLHFPSGRKVEPEELGYIGNNAPEARVGIAVLQDKGYITQIGLDALLWLLSKKEEYKHIDSKAKLVDLAHKEGWIACKGEGKQRLKQANSKATGCRCMVIDISRYLALFDIPFELSRLDEDVLEATTKASFTDSREIEEMFKERITQHG